MMGPGASGGYQASQVYPGYPYSGQYGGQYQYQAKTDQYGGGYFIAGGHVPPYHGPALVPATTSSSPSAGFPPSSATNSASLGFIYGPYSYGPYGAGRVIGPIIALAPGSLPVGSAPDCRPQGKAVPMMATTTA